MVFIINQQKHSRIYFHEYLSQNTTFRILSCTPPPSSIWHVLPLTPDLSIFVILPFAFKIQLWLVHHFFHCNCWYLGRSDYCPPPLKSATWTVWQLRGRAPQMENTVFGKIPRVAKRAVGAEANTTFCFHKSQPAPSEARGRCWRPSSKNAERHPGNSRWPFHSHWTHLGWSNQTTSSKCCASSVERV